MKFELGTGVECDLDILLRSRLLIQAMSGAGKSWLIRRILEQTFTSVQHLVFDSEGDFKTLREEFPYLLVAEDGGDIPASAETAGLLAEKLLELSVPAILDISGLPSGDDGGERALFVANFLRGLLNAPQRLWHDALVVLDEAQLFAPQTYNVVSRKTVNDSAGLVRKRGLGLVLATNRLSELHKTTSAHLANKLIGRSMGIDADSASRQLGMRRREATDLQTLEDGDFFAFGPAISKQVVRLHVGPVRTTHPSPGGNRSVPPPSTPEQIKVIVQELVALQPPPKETPDPVAPAKHIPCDHGKTIVELEQTIQDQKITLDEQREEDERLAAELKQYQEDASSFQQIRKLLAPLPVYQYTRDDDGGEHIEQIAPAVDEEAIVQQVLSRLPSDGRATVQVTPPEALRKKYLDSVAQRLYKRLEQLSPLPRQMMELLLGQDKFWPVTVIAKTLTGQDGGTGFTNTQTAAKDLYDMGLIVKGGSGGRQYKANVEKLVATELAPHGAKTDEVAAVVQHVLVKVAT